MCGYSTKEFEILGVYNIVYYMYMYDTNINRKLNIKKSKRKKMINARIRGIILATASYHPPDS